MVDAAIETIKAYHRATKHHFNRYARSAGAMDWANQPIPFRVYADAEQIRLPLDLADPPLAYNAVYTAADDTPAPIDANTLSTFLGLSLGLSAWKAAGGNRWSLRINPSSGNLHPTEGYLVLPDTGTADGGVFHYCPLLHALEKRIALPADVWQPLETHFGGSGFLLALTTIFWRESWKYGERAYRYCQLDAGHALTALALAARLHGWHLTCLTHTGDNEISALLALDRTDGFDQEAEAPELICWIATTPSAGPVARHLPQDWSNRIAALPVRGRPNRLSHHARPWPIIDQAHHAAHKPRAVDNDRREPFTTPDQAPFPAISATAAAIIRRRRSAVRYNPDRSISKESFFAMMARTLASTDRPPFNAVGRPPQVHLLVFVHRVDGLSPGLYALIRRPQAETGCRNRWHQRFAWQPAHAALSFWRLASGDVTDLARRLSCHQDIAGDSAFAVAMIAEFEPVLKQGAYHYRHLHWECGMIGQVLYLQAEAHDLRGTGIGCFFDDPVHELLGIEDESDQVLYHFTVGHPVEDTRLVSLPAYDHLRRQHHQQNGNTRNDGR